MRRGEILLLTTDIEGVDSTPSAISCKNIRREHTTYEIPKMGHIIYVGQSAGDKYVAFPRLWKNRCSFM